jgi:cell division septation protein DedD
MEEDQKLVIFAKKEVSLIFICMILISFLSFLMGVKIGKHYSIQKAGFSKEDIQEVNLRAKLEKEIERTPSSASPVIPTPKDDIKSSSEKLTKEFSVVAEEADESKRTPSSYTPRIEEAPKSEFTGKFTVQLGSYRSYADAEKFADGFRIRGYEPVIQEIQVKEKGMVYRVSIGVFTSQNEANEYVLAEKSLFQGQDYLIVKFD